MRAPRGLLILALNLVPAVLAAETERFDPHDPAALNEQALRRLKVGDRGTALIFLERAAVIAPGNDTIRRNLHAVRAYVARPGKLTAATEPSVTTPSPPDAPPMPPIPAPWPNR